ncbi:MAG TPA: hypothetical protein VN376_05270, partial [Longilinea sp.]|nr:hypothetical protein [Longilinea sp.]
DGMVAVLPGVRGDCNADSALNAGDISAIVLEIFDGDGYLPIDTPLGTYPGNAVGCNPNQDTVVDAGDISCTIILIFGGSCGGVQATRSNTLSMDGPALSVPATVDSYRGGMAYVPLSFESNGRTVSSLVFSIEYDTNQLLLNDADIDGDGIADAIHFNLPAGFVKTVVFDAAQPGKIGFAIYNPLQPQAFLVDSDIITIQFQALPTANLLGDMLFGNDPLVSFGSVGGQSILGDHSNGVVTTPTKIFLPAITR